VVGSIERLDFNQPCHVGGLSTLVIFSPVCLLSSVSYKSLVVAAGGISGLLTLIFGFSARIVGSNDRPEKENWKTSVAEFIPLFAAPIAIVFLGGLPGSPV
jgi:hypothetical protein